MVPTAPFDGHAQILAFYVVMEVTAGYAVDLFDFIAHHPAQEVHAVDALVKEAAAVAGPFAAPVSLVVIGLFPAPADVYRAVGQFAETA